jgi:ring-1,2-phenylacetyl-CoA epoxidase subunit PaaC
LTGAPSVAAPRSTPSPNPLAEYVMRLGDDRLVLGHRLSEWAGHGPILEEDIAMANIALDLVGHANTLLALAGEIEGKGRDADALAYFREATQFRNCLLVEQPKGDFGYTMVRQFLYDAYSVLEWEALATCGHAQLAAIAAKHLKETKYHLRHSSEWVVKLGDGTPESHARVERSLADAWRFTHELFVMDDVDAAVATDRIALDKAALRPRWETIVTDVLTRATLAAPIGGPQTSGGRRGRHSEALGHMLAEMQIVARSHPGATW